MSCIAGVFRHHGGVTERDLVGAMLSSMKPRAPDGDQIRCEAPICMGHAWLRTGSAAVEWQPPLSLDGRVWLTADARIDGRSELLRKLRAAGCNVERDATHAELILHAYSAFGQDLLAHLIGDFAFALWDGPAKRLICARDHLGVRPLHFVATPLLFAFASDADALLNIPGISDDLDEGCVADFLLFGCYQDPGASIYRAVRAVPPARMLEVNAGSVAQREYWRVPTGIEIRYRKHDDYVRRFDEIFQQAVNDRLPEGPVALQLSGGMDSTAIAAAVRSSGTQQPVTAFNTSCKSLFAEDQERELAETVAAKLSMPLVCQDLGDYEAFGRREGRALRAAFPITYPFLDAHYDMLANAGRSGARVLLSGQVGDAVLAPASGYFQSLARNRRYAKLTGEVGHHLQLSRSVRGLGLRSAIRLHKSDPAWTPPIPDWLERNFAGRVGLEARWKRIWDGYHGAIDGYHQLCHPGFSRNFEAAEVLKMPVVARYPFSDVRLVEFLLGLPGFMLAGKRILRRAMAGRLPPAVLSRPKTGLQGDMVRANVTNGKLDLESISEGRYCDLVDRERFVAAFNRFAQGEGSESTWTTVLITAPIALSQWLKQGRTKL
jgi:asparagine synthase (glutamine-hydrolysing)